MAECARDAMAMLKALSHEGRLTMLCYLADGEKSVIFTVMRMSVHSWAGRHYPLARGSGGVYAGDCTFGQGVSAASVLAVSAPIVMLSILCGAWLGLNDLMEGSVLRAIKALVFAD